MEKIMELCKKAAAGLQSMEKIQQVFLGVFSAALLVVSISAVVSDMENRKETLGTEHGQVTESLVTEEAFQTEATEIGTEPAATEITEVTEPTEVVQVIAVSITTTSIEKDLKVKIVDENNRLVSGKSFQITVTPEGKNTGKQYTDEDMDGMIHIKSMNAGNYTVFLQGMDDIQIVKDTVTAKVKEKIVYQKVEIKNEIKDESQIDVSKEDTANKNNVKVENEIKDTLPLLESKVTTTEIEKTQVDLSTFPDAVVSQEANVIRLEKKAETSAENGADSTEMEEEKPAEDVESPEGEEEKPAEDVESPESEDQKPAEETVLDKAAPGNVSEAAELSGESGETRKEMQKTAGEILASASASLPQNVQLYPCGKDTATKCDIFLNVEDASKIIKSIKWSIADEAIADMTIAEDGKSVHLMAKALGETALTAEISYQASSSEKDISQKQVSCMVTVSEYVENETQLVDLKGNLLYADAEAKEIATQKSYTSAEKFYTNPLYTGWQTFDGKLYYYTEEHVPAIGMHFIGGIKYEFNEDGSIIEKEEKVGIDVSKWQGTIDWKAVADAGIDFAIIRCGYRGSDTGTLVEDPKFKENIEGASKNGIRVGVYFFTQAITEAEAVEEASMAISMVEGYQLQFPIYIDTEEAYGRADRLSKDARTKIVKAFCETIKNAGYKAGIYASKAWFNDNLHASQLSFYHIWVAQYNTECNYKGRYDMWQYSDKGKIPGIKEKVDMNICYTKY